MNAVSIEIEKRALQTNSYIEAVVDYCEDKQIGDIEDVVEILHPNIIEKIRVEAIKKNYFRDKKSENINDIFFE